MAVVGYKIVSHEDFKETEEEINTLLKEGWVLHGDLKVTENIFSQAMVQEEHYGGVDYSLAIEIEDLDGIKYAIKDIADSLAIWVKTLPDESAESFGLYHLYSRGPTLRALIF